MVLVLFWFCFFILKTIHLLISIYVLFLLQSWFRATLLTISQLAGGLAAAGLVALLTPHGTVNTVVVHPAAEVTTAQGLFLEALLTSMLVFVVLMLAAEKHKGTFMAPVGM